MGQSWIFAGGEVPTVSRGCKRLLSRNNKYSIWRQGNKSWKLVKSERCSLIIVIVGDAIGLYSCILLPIMRRSHTCSKYKWLHSAPWIKKHQTSKISIWQIFNVKMLRSTRTPDGSGWFLSSSKHWNYGENVGAWATHLKSCLVDKANLPLRPPIDLSCDILPANQWVYAACTSRFQVVKQDALLEAWQFFSKCIWKALQIRWLSHYMSLNIKLKETLADEINSLEGISVELQSGWKHIKTMREEECQSTSMSPQTQNPSKTESFSHFTAFYEVVSNFLVFSITETMSRNKLEKGPAGQGSPQVPLVTCWNPSKPQWPGSQVSWGIVLPIFFGPSIGQNTKKNNHAHVENYIIHNWKVKKQETCRSWWQPPTSFWKISKGIQRVYTV